MEDILNHSYNTRSKRVYKIDMNNGGNTNNYNKPKFIVDLSGEKRVTKTSADYKIVINSLVDLSNKLIQRRALEIMPENDYGMPDISDTDSDDSDYKPEKTISSKCSNSKYIKYSKNENKYFLSLELKEQQNIKILEKKIRTLQNSRKPLRFKILELESLSNESKYNIIEKIEQLKKLDRGDNEYFKLSSWINWLDKLPFNNYTNINVKQNPTAISDFLLNAKNIMDKAVYGHYEAKDQIIINMAKMITNDQSRGGVYRNTRSYG
jgi:ATP-dependent Lon protease